MEYKEKIKSRKEYNLLILEQLEALINIFPNQRFGQIISNYCVPEDCRDFFFPESYDIWQYLNKKLEGFGAVVRISSINEEKENEKEL